MKLHELKPTFKQKKKKRVGRGVGSKKGTYSGRGIKGQKARSGYKKLKPALIAQLPKLRGEGFKRIKRENIANISVKKIEEHYKEGEEVSLASLIKKGLIKQRKIRPYKKVKILGPGKLTKKLKFASDIIYGKA